MRNPRLAGRYAKSLVDFAVEQNQFEAIYLDMKFLKGICRSNPDFVALLKSPIIKPTTKGRIIEAITKDKLNNITASFIRLLVNKGRESNLPEIISSFIDQYNEINEIHRVKLTTASPLTEELTRAILAKVKTTAMLKKIELETVVDESLIGGFVLETNGKSIDASILRDLKDVKKQFMNNDYMYKVR